jgi:hypothetical protein
MSSSALFGARSVISLSLTTFTGEEETRFGLRISVPVTTISLSDETFAWSSWTCGSAWVVTRGVIASSPATGC